MSWFKTLQKGFKDAVDKTKEAGARMEKVAKEALEKTKAAMAAPLPSVLVAAAEGDDPATLQSEMKTFQEKNPLVPSVMAMTDKDGKTLLHLACAAGATDTVKFLVGAQVCVSNAQCTMHNAQGTMHNAQCTMHNAQCTMQA